MKKCDKNIIRKCKCKCNAINECNELQIVIYKNCDMDILDHLFQKKCFGSDIKVKQCKTVITFDTIPESKILDASDLLILSNTGCHHQKI